MPVAVLGIDNIDEHERTAILGGRSELIKDIAGQLLPTIRAEHHAAAVGRPFAHRAGGPEPRRGQRAHGRSLRTGNVPGWRSATPFDVVDARGCQPAKRVRRNRYVMGE